MPAAATKSLEDVLPEATATNIAKLTKERARQITRLGYTAEHDQEHAPRDWAYFITRELEAIGLDTPAENAQAVLVKVGALALAALDALPEHDKLMAQREELARQRQAAIEAEHTAKQQELRKARDEAAKASADRVHEARSRVTVLEHRVTELEAELQQVKRRRGAA